MSKDFELLPLPFAPVDDGTKQWFAEDMRAYARANIAAALNAAPQPQAGLLEQHARDSAELRRLCEERDQLRRHLASAKADREEEYRQREAWRAQAGRLEEVLKSIAEKPQPYMDPGAWHKWAEEVQDLAREWAPEEE